MIRMINDPNELTGLDLTDKYILRKLNYHWFAYGKVGIVTAHSGTILRIEREETLFSKTLGRRAYLGTGRRFPGGSCPISAVACVCDTPDEVNSIIQIDIDAQAEFHQLIARTEGRVRALAFSSQADHVHAYVR
jgi:hypothetical protein